MFFDVLLGIYLALDLRLRTYIGIGAVKGFTNIALVVLVAHGHGCTGITGDNLHGVLGRVDGGVRGEQRCIEQIIVGGGDIACGVVGYVLCILSLRVILVLADVAVDVGLVDAVRGYGILEVLRKENGLPRVGSHLIVVVDEVHRMTVAVGGTTVPVIADIVEQVQTADGTVLSIHAAAHRPVAPCTVDQQVVVP